MTTCTRCNSDVGLLGALSFNRATGRCGKCEGEIKQKLARFRQAFLAYSQDGTLSPVEWEYLRSGAVQEGLSLAEALEFIRGDALHLLDRTLAFASADGLITEQEEQDFHRLRALLNIPDELASPLLQRLAYLNYLSNLRQGRLPTLQASVRLESDELCHLDMPATYHKVNAKSVSQIGGRLVASSKKLHFLSPAGGAEIPWKSVMRVSAQQGGVYLELSRKSGNGFYAVSDPYVTEATLDALVRMTKHQLIAPRGESDSRHIPHEVRQAVWQRDQGKCVQCGASGPGAWLEFDHIIPHSKGGANTVANVQLLCRRCNLAKANRI